MSTRVLSTDQLNDLRHVEAAMQTARAELIDSQLAYDEAAAQYNLEVAKLRRCWRIQPDEVIRLEDGAIVKPAKDT